MCFSHFVLSVVHALVSKTIQNKVIEKTCWHRRLDFCLTRLFPGFAKETMVFCFGRIVVYFLVCCVLISLLFLFTVERGGCSCCLHAEEMSITLPPTDQVLGSGIMLVKSNVMMGNRSNVLFLEQILMSSNELVQSGPKRLDINK